LLEAKSIHRLMRTQWFAADSETAFFEHGYRGLLRNRDHHMGGQ
jgi:hypothetical protein